MPLSRPPAGRIGSDSADLCARLWDSAISQPPAAIVLSRLRATRFAAIITIIIIVVVVVVIICHYAGAVVAAAATTQHTHNGDHRPTPMTADRWRRCTRGHARTRQISAQDPPKRAPPDQVGGRNSRHSRETELMEMRAGQAHTHDDRWPPSSGSARVEASTIKLFARLNHE
jgi:hypothetical protein